jgi:hypothetical protein
MQRERFVREAENVGIPSDKALALYGRLYAAPARPGPEPGRLLLAAIWFGVGLIVAASAWWATLLDAPSGGALALLAVWLAGFAAAAELTFRRGQRLLCGGLAAVALGYVAAIAGMALDLADAQPDDLTDPEALGLSAAALVLSCLVLARYRRPLLALPVALAGGSLLGGLFDLPLGTPWPTLLTGCALVAAGALLDLAGWRRFALWPHLVGAVAVGAAAFDRWADAATALVLALIAGAVGLALARIGYLILGIALLVAFTIDVSPEELIPVISLVVGLGVLACVVVVLRRGNPLEPWLARHDLRRRQRDLRL